MTEEATLNTNFNERDVRKFYRWLGHNKNEYTEIRVITWPPGQSKQYWVQTEDDFVKRCKEWNGKRQVYAGLNPRSRKGGSAEDVARVIAIPFDVDYERPKKTAATNKELNKAKDRCTLLNLLLITRGYKQPYNDMSGNGYRVASKVDIPITDDLPGKLEAFFHEINDSLPFTMDSIFDLPRIIKVPGTMSIKGIPSEERPHRLSYIVDIGDPNADVVLEQHIKEIIIKPSTFSSFTTVQTEKQKISDLRPCFKKFVEEGGALSEIGSQDHLLRLALVIEGHFKGYRPKQIYGLFKKATDYNPDETKDKVDRELKKIAEKGWKPWKCKTIHKHQGCLGPTCKYYANKILEQKGNVPRAEIDLFTVPCVKTFRDNFMPLGEQHKIFAKNYAIMYRNCKGGFEGLEEFAENLSINQQTFTASDIIGYRAWIEAQPREVNCNELRECLNYLPEFNCENCPLKQSSVFKGEVALGPFKLALKANRIYLINDQNEPLTHCKKNKFEQAKFKKEIRKITKLPLESVSKAIATLSMQIQETLQSKAETFQIRPHIAKEVLIQGDPSSIIGNNPPDYSIIDTEKLRWVFNVNPIADTGFFNIKTGTPEALFTFWEIMWSRLDKKLNLLITEPDISIPTRALYMEPILPDELLTQSGESTIFSYYPPNHEILLKWINHLGVTKYDEKGKKLSDGRLWKEIIELHITRLQLIEDKKQKFLESPIFWKLKSPLTPETTKKIATWDFEQLTQDYLTEGLQKDKDLVYYFRSKIPNILKKIPNDTFTLKKIAGQSDHGIITSPTKTSKTYTSAKICGIHHYRNLTESRALGFATADEVNPGALDGVVTPVGIDDIHRSDVRYEQLGGLLTMMEDGTASTGKGKATIITRCVGPLNYYANMKGTKSATVLMEDFMEIIKKFTTVAGTLGSRIACIIFNPEMETVLHKKDGEIYTEEDEKEKYNNGEPEKWVQINTVLIKYLQETVQPKNMEVWLNPKIQRWLNQSIPWYAKIVNKQLGEEGTFPDEVRNFWIDHAERGFKHVRGFALKQALMDHLKTLWVGTVDIESIIESAEMHLQYTCRSVNLESLKRMIKASKEIEWDKILADRLITIRPIYIRGLIIAAALHIQKRDPTPEAVKINELTEYWNLSNDAEDPYKFNEMKHKYSLKAYKQISLILDRINKRKRGFKDFNTFYLKEFGLQISKENDGMYLNFSKESMRLRDMIKNLLPLLPLLPKNNLKEEDKKNKIIQKNKIPSPKKLENGNNGYNGNNLDEKTLKYTRKTVGDVEPDLIRCFANKKFMESDFTEKAVELGLNQTKAADLFKDYDENGIIGYGPDGFWRFSR